MQFNDFEIKMIEKSAELLRALSNPVRVSILNFISKNHSTKVFDIHSSLNLDKSIASQHLKILRDARLVKTTRDGKNIYYEVDVPFVNHILKQVILFDKQTLAGRKNKK
ncbi:MAG: helix-turn-helix transcriptional regulator [Bacteroidetes bacterium]|nr:helix-turn-helix transcriptional regulator [Bacteroidota bacterium]